MPTCSHCGHQVGGNARSCPKCGQRGKNWKIYNVGFTDRSPTEKAWVELFEMPIGILLIPAMAYLLVYFGVRIVVGSVAFLFGDYSKVNWDSVNMFSQIAGWGLAIASAVGIAKDEARGYIKNLPKNAKLVLESIAILLGVISGVYLLIKIGLYAFFK